MEVGNFARRSVALYCVLLGLYAFAAIGNDWMYWFVEEIADSGLRGSHDVDFKCAHELSDLAEVQMGSRGRNMAASFRGCERIAVGGEYVAADGRNVANKCDVEFDALFHVDEARIVFFAAA